ncbi:MAG: adenylosuccinate lyase [Promethearchaeota archaeon CR_4]|nr:MAG: adenylosuccinate lyase [Candidatus Lokiarchaeota archaeon CR_4]
MSIHPIEFRYRTPEMASLFTEEAKLQGWLTVEAALAEAHAILGTFSKDIAEEIRSKATVEQVKLARVKQIEMEIQHDLMAMVQGLTEICSEEAGKYVHLGATSYDIEDTALALQLSQSINVLMKSVREFLVILVNQAESHREHICVGRTHGQHALPTTFGMRFAVWAAEIARHLDRLQETKKRIAVGKMGGAVGTMASFQGKGRQIQQEVMRILNLEPVLIANQVVQRDRHAEVLSVVALIAATCDKIARELRVLQRNEIAEIFEPFGKKQVGSSTMPQKRNPHKLERVCGLARVVKANIWVALENVSLEDERDLTNSAPERVIFGESFVLIDYMLKEITGIVKDLEFNDKNIQRNLNLTGGAILAEQIMVEMVNRGIGRQDAHEILRKAAIASREEGKTIKEVIMNNKTIMTKMTEGELDSLLDPKNYLGEAHEQVDGVVSHLRKKYLK